jgi:NAD(P)-dependent dehydrogenase (short-subunit alcohol dehydrogenase family)
MLLQGRVAVVTGAGRGIGREFALAPAGEGAAVVVNDIGVGLRGDETGEDPAAEVCAEIEAAGGRAVPAYDSVSDYEAAGRIVQTAIDNFGQIDILVNNAAVTDKKNMFDLTTEEWNRVLAITLTSPFLFGKYVAKEMIARQKGGRMVNVSSTSGYYGRDRATAYAAAKGGLVNLTKSMAIQLAPHNIRVNAVVPNKIGSPVGKEEIDPSRPVHNLIGRAGVPMDLARAALFLVSDDSDFIAATALFVDGGVTAMMPGRG